MTHYYKPGKRGEKRLLSLSIRGVTLEFITYTSLFSGREIDEGTRLLIENMTIPSRGRILDVGCGYGVIGITAAKLEPEIEVYMVDINPLAVKTARLNARLNGVEDRVTVLLGDAYEPVRNMVFNAIYSNPPLSAGREVVEKIVLGAREYLVGGGHAEFVLARGGEHMAEKARAYYSVVRIRRKKGYTLLYLEK